MLRGEAHITARRAGRVWKPSDRRRAQDDGDKGVADRVGISFKPAEQIDDQPGILTHDRTDSPNAIARLVAGNLAPIATVLDPDEGT